jgi:hypothetical protein
MTKSPLMRIVQAAAERFDKRPEYRASVQARAELQASDSKLTPPPTGQEQQQQDQKQK